MMINERSKRVIPFRPHDAKRVGEGCFYLDLIVWLNGDRIELGDNVAFNYGCYVNGFGGLTIGDAAEFGPYVMIHTANHETGDAHRPATAQGWRDDGPMVIGRNCWIGMGACILPGVAIGEGCVVGAASVVTGDLPPFTVSVGNPARVVRERPH
jgi:maltose O-acetyltransferase